MAIEIKSLRIGNAIEEGIVEEISNSLDEVHYSGDGYYLSDFCCNLNPIPLTEQILLKFGGYIHVGWDNMEFFRFDSYHCNMFELEIINGKYFLNDVEVKFLHDLQNCYYFYNNRKKELEINL